MVEILCDIDEAKLLLETARRVYPEAVPFIEDAMSVAPEVHRFVVFSLTISLPIRGNSRLRARSIWQRRFYASERVELANPRQLSKSKLISLS